MSIIGASTGRPNTGHQAELFWSEVDETWLGLRLSIITVSFVISACEASFVIARRPVERDQRPPRGSRPPLPGRADVAGIVREVGVLD